ncbi:MAG: FAD-dependent oxidoreductase [Planctomycetota bacterium]|nr:MAG: FAD-dependent oxidoreductase [Planctomycetota bacterium]
MGWTERWLEASGAPAHAVPDLAARARARARRFPFPVNHCLPVVEFAAEWLAPSFLLGIPRPARRLDAAAFDRLEARLQHHPAAWLRALHTLLRHPVLGERYADAAPPVPQHPLEALAEENRRRRSHWRSRFDVIVIGSGAGGAPVAWDLARRGFSVAIVEAGGLLRSEPSQVALESRYLQQGLTGSLSRDGMTLVLAGVAVGGTTAVNSGTSLRPPPERLAAWDAELGTRFREELGPWLDLAEERLGVAVPDRRWLDASASIIERGLRALGREGVHVLPRNAPDCRGSGRCCFGCPLGAKLSTDRSFLPEALTAGAVLYARTRASRIRETAGGIEVLVRGGDGTRRLRARRLVLAAGALSTPGLLRANRLGSRWRHAGNGLRFHPASKVFGLMPEPLPEGGIPQGIGYRAPELPRVAFEGVHTPPGPAAPMIAAAGARHRWWMDRYDRLATFGCMVRERGVGRVRDLTGLRRIEYSLHPADARDLGAALLLSAEALFAAGAERVLLPLCGPEAELSSPRELRRLRPDAFTPARLLTCGFHPYGTASLKRCVDERLRLRGSERIYVSDASVLPDSPGVNPQVTIVAFALRCAQAIAEDLERSTAWASGSANPWPDTTCSSPTSARQGAIPSPSS